MSNFFKKYWLKLTNQESYKEYKIEERVKKDVKLFQANFEGYINKIQNKTFSK